MKWRRHGSASPRSWALVLGICLCASIHPGCDENREDLPYAPIDCVRSRPLAGEIQVLVTINAENPEVAITFYKGDFEDGIVVQEETSMTAAATFELPVDDYAVTAEYKSGVDTILILGATRITVSSEEYRDADCWSTQNGSVDLRLGP